MRRGGIFVILLVWGLCGVVQMQAYEEQEVPEGSIVESSSLGNEGLLVLELVVGDGEENGVQGAEVEEVDLGDIVVVVDEEEEEACGESEENVNAMGPPLEGGEDGVEATPGDRLEAEEVEIVNELTYKLLTSIRTWLGADNQLVGEKTTVKEESWVERLGANGETVQETARTAYVEVHEPLPAGNVSPLREPSAPDVETGGRSVPEAEAETAPVEAELTFREGRECEVPGQPEEEIACLRDLVRSLEEDKKEMETTIEFLTVREELLQAEYIHSLKTGQQIPRHDMNLLRCVLGGVILVATLSLLCCCCRCGVGQVREELPMSKRPTEGSSYSDVVYVPASTIVV
mmetsp:Transcript_13015/g.36926  ORF Transcript_13015/g.36926 Transcript_13015/m.36926 type:complete len:346 (-) Transcript_13015:112-1149(-)|eukprot:CAMPEP_0119134444 /NCGR_PEP_ID=MMETSP1310-20130426/16898_1 /TAXON_ID=464262 /ORGANISM="Genus nov. species nov., Strain RCC2339" /LENGTH=345 /DNA_ID=CAMNT_0007125237 /DNA_START=149 /DNA_END=1186 /DNA_ORIENTATION=-